MTDYRLENEVRIPVAAVVALSTAAERDGEPVASAVRDSGRAAGEEITRRIAEVVSLYDLDTDDFWAAVNAEAGARGLGTFEWHRGIGGHAELVVHGSPEEEGAPHAPKSGRSFPFTEGLVEGLLGAAAEESVGVVQAPPDGGDALRFVIGSPIVLRHVRLRIEAGASLHEALEDV